MGFRPHPIGAEVNPESPRAWATCGRCGMLYNQYKLRWQFQWRGTQTQNTQLLVCQSCLDVPQRQLGTIIIPPDPMPVLNARPELYQMDEYWPWLWEGGQGAPIYQENGTAPITLEYSIYSNDGDWPWPP